MDVLDLVRKNSLELSDSVSYLALSDMCAETFGQPLPTNLLSSSMKAWNTWDFWWDWSRGSSCFSSSSLSSWSALSSWSSLWSSSLSSWSALSQGNFLFGVPDMIFNIGDEVILDDGRWFWSGRIVDINPVFTNQVILSHVAKIFNLGSEADFVQGAMPRSLEAYPDEVKKVVTYVSGNLLSEIGHTLFRETRRT